MLTLKEKIHWLTPIPYIERLLQKEFWANEMATFGSQAFYTGLKICGRREGAGIAGNTASGYAYHGEHMTREYSSGLEGLHGEKWSEHLGLKAELKKRKDFARIFNGLTQTMTEESLLDTYMENEYGPLPYHEKVRAAGLIDVVDSNRDAEIWELILNHEHELAISTWDFAISENLFRFYINRLNTADKVSPEDFRHFLIRFISKEKETTLLV